MTPGPGIYFNAFIYVYSPRAGADNTLGTNVNRKPLSFCPFVASFKTISLKYDFKHILNDFIHVYSPRAGTDSPLGTKFWCQQKFLISLPICCQFKKKISLKSDFLPFFMCFFHMYIAQGRDRQHIGDKILMTTERPFLFAHMLQVSKWSLWNLTHFYNDFIHVSYGAREYNPLGTNFWCQQTALITLPIQFKFKKRNLILYTFWMILYMYIAPGQGQTTPWGQTFDVNRKPLSLCPFDASLKKEIWFYTHL